MSDPIRASYLHIVVQRAKLQENKILNNYTNDYSTFGYESLKTLRKCGRSDQYLV